MPKPASDAPADTRSAAEKIDEMIEKLDDWRGAMLADIRRWIHEEDAEVIEEWKWRGAPVWSHDGMYANAGAFKGKVKLTFHHGAQLEDKGKLFNNGLGGNKWRAIDIPEGEPLDETKFKALIREAVTYNQSHSVPKSKGSRK